MATPSKAEQPIEVEIIGVAIQSVEYIARQGGKIVDRGTGNPSAPLYSIAAARRWLTKAERTIERDVRQKLQAG